MHSCSQSLRLGKELKEVKIKVDHLQLGMVILESIHSKSSLRIINLIRLGISKN